MLRMFTTQSISVIKAVARRTTNSVYNQNPQPNNMVLDHITLAVVNLPSRWYSEVKSEPMITEYDYVKKATTNYRVVIIDVREPDELKEHGKIQNSINIPLGSVSTVLGTMTDVEFQKTYKRPKPSKDSEIIFYCMIGKRSGKAQQSAIELGFKNTKNYLGSWTDWATKQTT